MVDRPPSSSPAGDPARAASAADARGICAGTPHPRATTPIKTMLLTRDAIDRTTSKLPKDYTWDGRVYDETARKFTGRSANGEKIQHRSGHEGRAGRPDPTEHGDAL